LRRDGAEKFTAAKQQWPQFYFVLVTAHPDADDDARPLGRGERQRQARVLDGQLGVAFGRWL